MTESELRNKTAGLAEEIAASGKYIKGSAEMQEVIDTYNAHEPLARGVKYSYDIGGYCGVGVSYLFIKTDLSDLIVTECGAYEFMANAKARGQWKPKGTYIPRRGDIIVYAYEQIRNGKPYTQFHVGMVTNADANIVDTTEFNVDNRVLMLAHKPNEKAILGYWAVDYASAASDNTFTLEGWPEPPKKNGTYTPAVVVSNNKIERIWK